MRIFILISVLLLGTIIADVAKAETRGVKPGKEAEQWAGVGILRTGAGWCSAALISPNIVLTAAHCVYPEGSRKLVRPENVTFLAGWREGITAAKRSAVRIVAHRNYDPTQPYNDKNIAADLAIVELESPIPAEAARSYGRLNRVRIGEPVSVVSFSGMRSDIASINESCSTGSRKGDILLLSCESHAGMSGAPIFSMVNGKPKIAALVSGSRISHSGKNNGIALSIAAPLGRVQIDAKATRSTLRQALPYWSARAKAAPSTLAKARRKTVKVGSRIENRQDDADAGGRKVVRPPVRSGGS